MTKRILIVDDEPDFSQLVQYRLKDERYEFESASRGMEGLNKSHLSPPDVILLDLLLPDSDGLTLCEIFRRRPATQHTPIVMISGVTTDKARHSAMEAGAHQFLSKPVDFDRLKLTIRTLLEEDVRQALPTTDVESVIG